MIWFDWVLTANLMSDTPIASSPARKKIQATRACFVALNQLDALLECLAVVPSEMLLGIEEKRFVCCMWYMWYTESTANKNSFIYCQVMEY